LPYHHGGAKVRGEQLIGTRIGNFLLTGILSEAEASVLFRAEHPELGRRAAIKVLDLQQSALSEVKTRFLEEARLLAQIQHPNVVSVFDFGKTIRHELYYVMELLQGTTLDRILERYRSLTPGQLWPYLEQICDGLEVVHAHGIVHRDLKPANVFVLEGKRSPIKLVGFGIARLDEPLRAGAHRPLSVAPEQAAGRGDEVGAWTDLYALGVLIHWALAGRPPFDDPSPAALLAKHASEEPPPLVGRMAVPPAIAELVGRCLAKAPEERPSSAAEIAETFRDALAMAEAPTRPVAVVEPARTEEGAVPARLTPRAPSVPAVVASPALSEVRRAAVVELPPSERRERRPALPEEPSRQVRAAESCEPNMLSAFAGVEVSEGNDVEGQSPATAHAAVDEHPDVEDGEERAPDFVDEEAVAPAEPERAPDVADGGPERAPDFADEEELESAPEVADRAEPEPAVEGADPPAYGLQDGRRPSREVPGIDPARGRRLSREVELAIEPAREDPARELARRETLVDEEPARADEPDADVGDSVEEAAAPLEELDAIAPARRTARRLRPVIAAGVVIVIAGALLVAFVALRPGRESDPARGARKNLEIASLRSAAELRSSLVAALGPRGDATLARQIHALSSADAGAVRELAAAVKGSASGQLLLGQLLLTVGAPQAALAVARAALKQEPKSPQAQVLLGEAICATGDPQAAIAHYERAIAAAASDGRAHLRLGEARQLLGNLDLALAAYQRALAVDPKLAAQARTMIGEAFALKGQVHNAIVEYRAAIVADARYAPAHLSLGRAEARRGFFDDALVALDQAVKADPEQARAWQNRGAVLLNLGRKDEAITSYRRAIALRPDLVEARYQLGEAYLALGQTAPAREQFEAVVAVEPEHAQAVIALEKLRQK
jgi:tetratricopeptide (TPR) repeat protein